MSLLAPARGMSTLPAKGGFSRPSSIRSAGSHRGLWDCDYSPHRKHFLPLESRVFQMLGWVFILNELLYYSNSSNHNIYMILSFVNSQRYLVDWNGRRRLLENIDQFSSCDVTLPQSSLSYGNSKWSSVGRTIVQSHEP